MRVIKLPIQLGWNSFQPTTYCEPLWVEYQGGDFVVWCKEYTVLAAEGPLRLYLATTGEQVDDSLQYVGTATNHNRTFVVHLFKA